MAELFPLQQGAKEGSEAGAAGHPPGLSQCHGQHVTDPSPAAAAGAGDQPAQLSKAQLTAWAPDGSQRLRKELVPVPHPSAAAAGRAEPAEQAAPAIWDALGHPAAPPAGSAERQPPAQAVSCLSACGFCLAYSRIPEKALKPCGKRAPQ